MPEKPQGQFALCFNGTIADGTSDTEAAGGAANVVLTAGALGVKRSKHAYVSQADWVFPGGSRRGCAQPRGRALLFAAGYAAQRTNELQSGLYGRPNRRARIATMWTSPPPRFILSPAAGSGSAAYLPSDATPNPWLTERVS